MIEFYDCRTDAWKRAILTSNAIRRFPNYYNFRLINDEEGGLYLRMGESWAFDHIEIPPIAGAINQL